MSSKWIDISKDNKDTFGHVVVVQESTEVTDALPNTPLNFIAVFGPARQGKSFLQGALMRKDGIFKVSSAAAPCTSGVDLSRGTLSHAEFIGMPSSEDSDTSSRKPSIGFLDVEGSGAEDVEHNLKLALPALLLSKVWARSLVPLVTSRSAITLHTTYRLLLLLFFRTNIPVRLELKSGIVALLVLLHISILLHQLVHTKRCTAVQHSVSRRVVLSCFQCWFWNTIN